MFADYYEVRARGGSAYIYKQANSTPVSKNEDGKKVKNYIAKIGDLNISKVRFISESNGFFFISFFDTRLRKTFRGFVDATEVRKRLVKVEKTKEELKALREKAREERKKNPNTSIKVNRDVIKQIYKSYNLSNAEEFIDFLKGLPNKNQRYQNSLEAKEKQSVKDQESTLALNLKKESLVSDEAELTTALKATEEPLAKLNAENKSLTVQVAAYREEIKTLKPVLVGLEDDRKKTVKKSTKEAYIWTVIAGLLAFFVGSKFSF